MRPLSGIPDERGRILQGMIARDAYQRHLEREVLGILESAYVELSHDLEQLAPSSRDRARQAALWRQVGQRLSTAYRQVEQHTTAAMSAYASVEFDAARSELAARLGLDATLAPPSSVLLSQHTLQSVAAFPIEGLPLGEWWRAQAASLSVATRRTLQTGMVKGEGTRELVARIIPPRGSTAPAVWRQARSQATSLVRTASAAVHNDAAMRGYESAGDGVTAEYELLTARDNRVSVICAALDGRRYRYDDPARKVPPLHWLCRTTTNPVLNHAALGLREPGPRSALSFQSFDGWLKRESQTTQNAILGPARAEWYRTGRMGLSQLVDEDTRVLTLAELEQIIAPATPRVARRGARS